MSSLRIKLNDHQKKNTFTSGSYWARLEARLPNLCTKIEYMQKWRERHVFICYLVLFILQWERLFVQTLVQLSSCWIKLNYHLQNSLLPTQSRLSIQASLKAIQHPWLETWEETFEGFSFTFWQRTASSSSAVYQVGIILPTTLCNILVFPQD